MDSDKCLYWSITGACQLSCRYCFYETGMNQPPFGQVNTCGAEALIVKLGRSFPRVVLTGGEPLLNSSFWDLVALARRSGMTVSFLTDGINLDAACVENVRRHTVSSVYISLDSLSPGINEALRRPRSTNVRLTDRIVRNVETLACDRPDTLNIIILQTVCRTNIDSVEPMIEFCRLLGLDLLVHPAGMPLACPDVSDIRLESSSSDELLRLERAMLKWADGHEGRTRYTRLAMDLIHGRPTEGMNCPMGTESFFLDVDGTLSPCFHRLDIRLGNVYETDPRDIIARDMPQDLRTAPCASLGCACMLD